MTLTTDEPHDTALWQAGWYRFARRLVSPNQGPRPANTRPDLIVLHSISLPPGHYGGDDVQALFCNTLDWDAHPYYDSIRNLQVSAHFFVRRNGELMQFVSCDARAWHAGASQYRGRSNCNDDSIGIELEGLEGDTFTADQYETLSALCSAIALHYPVQYIAGHEHIAAGRKGDPGAGFSWVQLQQSLAWPDQCFPQVSTPASAA